MSSYDTACMTRKNGCGGTDTPERFEKRVIPDLSVRSCLDRIWRKLLVSILCESTTFPLSFALVTQGTSHCALSQCVLIRRLEPRLL